MAGIYSLGVVDGDERVALPATTAANSTKLTKERHAAFHPVSAKPLHRIVPSCASEKVTLSQAFSLKIKIAETTP